MRKITIDPETLSRASGKPIELAMHKDGWEAYAFNEWSIFHLFPAASIYGVSQDNALIYETTYLNNTEGKPIMEDGNPKKIYLEADDVITVRKSDRGFGGADQYSWSGMISGRDSQKNPERGYYTHMFDSFHQSTILT